MLGRTNETASMLNYTAYVGPLVVTCGVLQPAVTVDRKWAMKSMRAWRNTAGSVEIVVCILHAP